MGSPLNLGGSAVEELRMQQFLNGYIGNGFWVPVPAIFSLIFSGTGQVTIDQIDLAGNITTSVIAKSLKDAVNIVETYVADGAVKIRANFPPEVLIYICK